MVATLKDYPDTDTIVIDKKVCFYRRLFSNPMKPCWTNSDPVELVS